MILVRRQIERNTACVSILHHCRESFPFRKANFLGQTRKKTPYTCMYMTTYIYIYICRLTSYLLDVYIYYTDRHSIPRDSYPIPTVPVGFLSIEESPRRKVPFVPLPHAIVIRTFVSRSHTRVDGCRCIAKFLTEPPLTFLSTATWSFGLGSLAINVENPMDLI